MSGVPPVHGKPLSYDSESMWRFAGVELAEEVTPDETSILSFRPLLEKHKLTEAIFSKLRTF